MSERMLVVREALSWMNTPYHHQADVKGVGVDCAMLPTRVFVDTGLVPPFDPRPYPSDWHLHRNDERYLTELLKYGRKVSSPSYGDLAMFRYGRSASHSGIIIGTRPLTFIHAYLHKGVILSELVEEDFAARLDSYWSIFK